MIRFSPRDDIERIYLPESDVGSVIGYFSSNTEVLDTILSFLSFFSSFGPSENGSSP